MSLGAEWMLRHFDWTAHAVRSKRLEYQIGREDARYGWALLPSKTTLVGASQLRYAVDAWGGRAASDRAAPDPARPSLIVAGESIAFGYGLEYEQTFAAVLGGELALQVVNVGVGGYGTDQAALRLEDALQKLEKPVAIVQVFLSAQLHRNVRTTDKDNAPSAFTANDEEACQGNFIKLSVDSTGRSYTMTIPAKQISLNYRVR